MEAIEKGPLPSIIFLFQSLLYWRLLHVLSEEETDPVKWEIQKEKLFCFSLVWSKQKSGNVHMDLEPSSSYQAAETMNTKELEFSPESHAERRENMNPRYHEGVYVSQ